MPENAGVNVKIRRNPNDPLQCIVVPQKFIANRGGTVTFEHDDLPRRVVITFPKGSPFAEHTFESGETSHTVVNSGRFDFTVSWVDELGKGHGNGTGEVPPG